MVRFTPLIADLFLEVHLQRLVRNPSGQAVVVRYHRAPGRSSVSSFVPEHAYRVRQQYMVTTVAGRCPVLNRSC